MEKTKEVTIELGLPYHNEDTNLQRAVKGTLAAFFYGCCSVSSAFVSKALMDTLAFDFPVLIMVMQMMLTICTLELLTVLRIIHIPSYSIKRGISFAAPAFFYGTNAILALTALSHMNIAMYGVLKRCVPVSTMFLSMIILKKGPPSKRIVAFVLLLTIGCVIAGYGDLGFNMTAYVCGIGSNFTHALYLILVQMHAENHLSVAETMQLNSYNTLPLLAIAAFVKGEVGSVHEYPRLFDASFIALFLMAISVGMMLNYSLFLCTSLTSALTTSVTGGIKALVQTLLGLVTFGGVSYNMSTFLGISMNLSGSIGYIWTKYKENKSATGLSLKKVMSLTSLGEQSKGEQPKVRRSNSNSTTSNGSIPKGHMTVVEYDDEGNGNH